MADIRDHPEQDQEFEGAGNAERVIDACRRNNVELLKEIIESLNSEAEVAQLLNNAKSVLGTYAFHEAALRANYEVIDFLLDQDGFEVDPLTTREGDTPLHCVVRYSNEHPEDQEYSEHLIKMMLEAGCDPRIANKGHLKPRELVDPRNTSLREVFEEGEFFRDNERNFAHAGAVQPDDDDEGPTGSASDSDFEEELVNGTK